MKTIAVYSRKSKWTGKGDSVENQIELCREYIRSHYGETNTIVYEDEGFSGGNIDRPQFRKLISDSRGKKFDVLMCYRLDRISRNIADFAGLIEDLNKLNIAFVSIREQFDTSTPMGRAMMYIASVFAQLERETIAERIRDNMLELAKTGRWLGGITPTGYKSEGYSRVTVDGRAKRIFRLVPVPEEQEIVRIIYAKYLELKSQTALETYLIRNNIKTKNGKYFTRFTIRTMLDNPVYAIADSDMFTYFLKNNIDVFANEGDFDGRRGVIAYNKTEQVAKKTNKQRNISEWIISVGRHEGIISGHDWCRVQEILGENENRRYRMPRSNNALLTGIIRCSCGSIMRPKMHRAGQDKFSYVCEMKEKSRGEKCKQPNVNGLEVDKIVLDAIEEMLRPENEIHEELKSLARKLEHDNSEPKTELKSLRTLYNKNKTDIDNLIEKLKYIDNDLMQDITDEIKKLKKANLSLEAQINELSKETVESLTQEETAELALQIMGSYFNIFNRLDLLQKRAMLKSLIKDAVAEKDEIALNLLDSGELCPLGEYCK